TNPCDNNRGSLPPPPTPIFATNPIPSATIATTIPPPSRHQLGHKLPPLTRHRAIVVANVVDISAA
ncbi:MAG: hypothetical protein LUD39_00090, partial [Opitutae bacterium]|nr:hypothetical protein [Opitutae bacterium]